MTKSPETTETISIELPDDVHEYAQKCADELSTPLENFFIGLLQEATCKS